MEYELTARISIKLSTDAKSQADTAATVLAAWKTFVGAVAAAEGAVAELRIGPAP